MVSKQGETSLELVESRRKVRALLFGVRTPSSCYEAHQLFVRLTEMTARYGEQMSPVVFTELCFRLTQPGLSKIADFLSQGKFLESKDEEARNLLSWINFAAGLTVPTKYEATLLVQAFPAWGLSCFFSDSEVHVDNVEVLEGLLAEASIVEAIEPYKLKILRLHVSRNESKSSPSRTFRQSGRRLHNAPQVPEIVTCVSGEARSYEECAKVLQSSLRTSEANVMTFVHTWNTRAAKFPIPSHASQFFVGNFLKEYLKYFPNLGQKQIELELPNFSRPFLFEELVKKESVVQAYQAESVKIQNQWEPPVSNSGNQEKMHLGIFEAWTLARMHIRDTTMVVRTRPDTIVNFSKEEWLDLYLLTQRNPNLIVVDQPARIMKFPGPGAIGCGDQFAAGSNHAMEIYAQTYLAVKRDETEVVSLQGQFGFPGHSSIAANLISNGIEIIGLQQLSINSPPIKRKMVNPAEIKKGLLLDSVESDLALRLLRIAESSKLSFVVDAQS